MPTPGAGQIGRGTYNPSMLYDATNVLQDNEGQSLLDEFSSKTAFDKVLDRVIDRKLQASDLPEEYPSILSQLESGLSMGTGMAGDAAGLVTGIATLLGTLDPKKAVEIMDKTSNLLTYQPRDQASMNRINRATSPVLRPIEKGIGLLDEFVTDVTGSHTAGDVSRFIPELVLDRYGPKI